MIAEKIRAGDSVSSIDKELEDGEELFEGIVLGEGEKTLDETSMDGDEARVDETDGMETIEGSEGARTSKGDEIRVVGDENGKARANEGAESVGK